MTTDVGAASARGRYLAFLDDDDRWHPERLARHIEAHRHVPSAVLSFCGMRSIDESGAVIAEAAQTRLDSMADVASNAGTVKMPNCVIQRSAFTKAGGFDSTLQFAEDLDLVLRLARLGPFAFVDGAFVDYRAHRDNTVKRHRELVASIDAVLRFHLALAALRAERGWTSGLKSAIRANDRYAWWAALRATRAGRGSGRVAGALSELAWLMRTAPFGLADALTRRLRR